MTATEASAAEIPHHNPAARLLPVLTGALFVILFFRPATLLVRDWWSNPEAGHGLLLAPVAVWLAWKKGVAPDAKPNPGLGILILAGAILLRSVSELAAELFTMRFSMIVAGVGLVVYYRGWRQIVAWWLSVLLLVLAIPLPELATNAMALPLQLRASRMGAALLEWRHVPVRLDGNVIQLPGHRLFVTEACSGLRSLTALLSLGFLMGGLWLSRVWTRVLLIAVALPIAIAINGVRVFLTGFLVFFVDPKLGEGFMHLTEGWLLFGVSLVLIGAATGLLSLLERSRRRTHAA